MMADETARKGHGEKQSRKEDDAILALLAEPTIERAAKRCGVAPATLWRWLQSPEFQAKYRKARRQIFENAILRLQHTAQEAVEALKRNLTCEVPAVEVRAALGVLDQAVKAAELYELQERVKALEEDLHKKGEAA
jgi:hypothetical protein